MRKSYPILWMILLCCFSLSSQAALVGLRKAKPVAAHFLSNKKGINVLETSLTIDSLTWDGKSVVYMFNHPSGGFVIVSGDDAIQPVLAYSATGRFNRTQLPIHISKWIDGYKTQIAAARQANMVASANVRAEWTRWIQSSANPGGFRNPPTVAPLMTTKWDQSPFYNDLCPNDVTAGERTVTGCVATALAQVVKFWNYPTQGQGFHRYTDPRYGAQEANFARTTYQWSNMPDSVRSANNAVATLMYHCGVAVDMAYGTGSSGGSSAYVIISGSPSPTANTEYALRNYFGYDTTVRGIDRSNYTDAQWKLILRNELSAGRPLPYAGFGQEGGHAFVCDGYDANDMFHFNWGWSGLCDGFYTVNNLAPASLGTGAGNGRYNDGQQVIIGVKPPRTQTTGGSGVSSAAIRLAMASDLRLNPNVINYLDSTTATWSVLNASDSAFTGAVGLAVFKGNTLVQTLDSIQVSLAGHETMSAPREFRFGGLPALIPDTSYKLFLFYKKQGANWSLVQDSGSFVNSASFQVLNTFDIELNSALAISVGGQVTTRYTQGDTISVAFDVKNQSNTARYNGYLSMEFYDLAGNFVDTLFNNYPLSLDTMQAFAQPVTYNTPSNIEPGSYLAVLWYADSLNANIKSFVGSGLYQNPIQVNVVAPALQADSYEVNDTLAQATALQLDSTASGYMATSVGANINRGLDVDYYSVTLSDNARYKLKAKVSDAGNTRSFTSDVSFSYTLDTGRTISQIFDDSTLSAVTIQAPATIIFTVAPYFVGRLGTYQLSAELLRDTVPSCTPTSSNESRSICAGASTLFGARTLSASGTYADTLRNAAGCDSIATLILTVGAPATTNTSSVTICSGASYTFGSSTLISSGTYSDTVRNVNGCDSVITTLNLTVNPTSYNVSASICAGGSYTFGTSTLTTAGIYADTLRSSTSCDSIVNLTLTVNQPSASTIARTICQGNTFVFGTQSLTTTGSYTNTVPNAAGCDSVITLNLTVNPTSASAISASVCNGTPYIFGGVNRTSTGVYTNTIQNSLGCDSVVTLTLTVGAPATTNTSSVTICAGSSYVFGSSTLTTSGTYSDTVRNVNGCDSVITSLNLIVSPTSYNVSANICTGGSYTFGTSTLTTAGVYADTLTSAGGCDSIVNLTLAVYTSSASTIARTICEGNTFVFGTQSLTTTGTYNNTVPNAAGCDSVITLNLTVNPTSASTQSASICEGTPYVFGGVNRTISGVYTNTLTNSFGCDSVITLTLTVRPTSASITTATICQGSTYSFGGNTYATSGTYTSTLTNSLGCDSVVALNLTVNPTVLSTISASICTGGSYTFGTSTLTTAGIYADTLTSASSCDSIVTLTLTVNQPSASTIARTICEGNSFVFGTQSLTTTGTYTNTVPNAAGCDSVITLNLTVNPTSASTLSASICAGTPYDFGGVNRTESGVYTNTLQNSLGCDSVVTLTLTVRPTSTSSTSASICQGSTYDFGGNTYASSGTYTSTLTNSLGCDSVATLNLTVNPTVTSTISATVCDGASYTFGTRSFTAAGIYADTLRSGTGCDSIVTLTLTVNLPTASTIFRSVCEGNTFVFGTQSLTTAGVYTNTVPNAVGCDSIITLNLTVNSTQNLLSSRTVCEGTNVLFGGRTLTTTGIYSDTLLNSNGCDSIITLNLTVNPASRTPISHTMCAGSSYVFNNQTLTLDGTYTNTLVNAIGCDSIITLTLNVTPYRRARLNVNICSNSAYLFGGRILNRSGVYRDTIVNAILCDSVTTLTLTVDTVARPIITYNGADNSLSASTSGTSYAWFRNGVEISGEVSQTLSNILANTLYKVIAFNGDCPSDTSAGIIIGSVSGKQLAGVSMYPNPVTDKLVIDYNHNKTGNIEVLDAAGKSVIVTEIQSTEIRKELNVTSLPNGLYNIRITNASGVFQSKFVKF